MKAALLASIVPVLAQADKFAVLAAGSSGFFNYRHQADVCHAYHVLIKGGVPADNIIVMMQDDVANSTENPFPGKLYNQPGDDAPDVYAGCKIDYRGDVVTAKLFTEVITGNAAAVPKGGKVLKSGPNDEVFLNFADHGGVGLVAFPNGSPLYVKDLSSALKQMQSKKMFKELVFYMEACESGSMFPGLAADGKILAVTAANAKESSWGFYCGSAAKAHGQDIGSCLGDLFSIAWMEDSDLGNLASETFATQIQRVTKRTNKSHVMVFGDKYLESETIGKVENSENGPEPPFVDVDSNAVDVRDLELAQAVYRWTHATEPQEKEEALRSLQIIAAARKADEELFKGVVHQACSDVNLYKCEEKFLEEKNELKDMDCHKQLAHTIFSACPRRHEYYAGGWSSFNMQFSQTLVNMCEGQAVLGKDTHALTAIIQSHCDEASGKSSQMFV